MVMFENAAHSVLTMVCYRGNTGWRGHAERPSGYRWVEFAMCNACVVVDIGDANKAVRLDIFATSCLYYAAITVRYYRSSSKMGGCHA